MPLARGEFPRRGGVTRPGYAPDFLLALSAHIAQPFGWQLSNGVLALGAPLAAFEIPNLNVCMYVQ